MSASSSRPIREDKHLAGQEKQFPAWIDSILGNDFFIPCPIHEQAKNDLDYYCINCNTTACKHCISTNVHENHCAIKIYRYSYKDAVQLNDVKKHINCSQIQPYRNNGQQVLLLHPLPHHGTKTDEDIYCKVCGRKLKDGNKYSYCSIACKVEEFSKKTNNYEAPSDVFEAPEESKKPRKSGASRRKGIPHRAPSN